MKTLILLTVLFFSAQINAQILNDVWELTELNDPNQTDSYPYISDDGLRIYFVGNDGVGNNIYFSSRPDLDTDFEPRQLLDSSFFADVLSSWFSVDELDVYYSTGANLFHASRPTTASPFGIATSVALVGGGTSFIGGPSLTPGLQELYMFNGFGLMEYEYVNDSTYTFVSEVVPPAGFDGSVGQLSKDGLELYWTLAPIGTDSNYLYMSDRIAIGDDFLNATELNNVINSSAIINSQPSYASAANVLVWVRNSAATWEGNNLFIAQNSSVSIEELSIGTKELVKIVDLMGREAVYAPGVVLIYIYSDGSTERKFGF